jgi:VanZ family protein
MIIAISSIPSAYLPKVEIFRTDKLVHVIVFCIFGLLLYRSYSNKKNISPGFSKVYFFTIAGVIVLSIFIELYQGLIPGRRSDIYDLVANIIGGLFSLILVRMHNKALCL